MASKAYFIALRAVTNSPPGCAHGSASPTIGTEMNPGARPRLSGPLVFCPSFFRFLGPFLLNVFQSKNWFFNPVALFGLRTVPQPPALSTVPEPWFTLATAPSSTPRCRLQRRDIVRHMQQPRTHFLRHPRPIFRQHDPHQESQASHRFPTPRIASQERFPAPPRRPSGPS